MRMTDGKRTVEITIQYWDGSGYGPDWSRDYFNAGTVPYDEETDTYTVESVDYCIDMATDWRDPDSPYYKEDENGDPIYDDNVWICVKEIFE